MRLLAILLASLLVLAPSASGQWSQRNDPVHCEPDKSKPTQDDAELEPKCLALLKGLASRSGDVLTLTLDDGNKMTLRDETEACDRHDAEKCLLYRLAAYYPTQQLFVVERTAYESYDVIVISRSGAITRMDNHPHLSSSGKRLIAVAAFEAWEVERDLAVYSIGRDSLELEWGYKADEYEMWTFDRWDGDDRVQLNVTLWTERPDGKRTLVTQAGQVTRTLSGWQLTKNLSR